MNEKLTVKNFGPIREAELDLKKVTIFIGPQGSGKSALAKLVAICKDGAFLADSHLGKQNINYFEKYQTHFFVNPNTNIDFISQKYSFNYKPLENNFILKDSGEIVESLNQIFPSSFHSTFESTKNAHKSYLEIKETGFGNYRVIYPMVESIVNGFIKLLNPKIKYITTDRLLVSSISDSILGLLNADVALQKSTTEFGNYFEIARLNIPKLFIEYLDVTYKFENGRNFVYHNETDSIPLSASASGYQSVIPLHLTVEHFSKEGNTFFIVEEPELNIFPTAQKQLIGYLADRCTKGDNSLFINTHSPYVLSAINNLIFAYKVAHEVPEMADEVAKIIPREQWLNPDDVAAYYVGDGIVKSIMEDEVGLIGENELDAISEDIAGERDDLFRILKSKKRETVD